MQDINPSFHFCWFSNPANENFSHVKKCIIPFLCTSSIFHGLSRLLLAPLTFLPVSSVCRKINTWTHEYRHFVSTLLRIQQFTQIMLYKHTLAYRKEACVPCSVHSKTCDKLRDMYTRTIPKYYKYRIRNKSHLVGKGVVHSWDSFSWFYFRGISPVLFFLSQC